MSHGGGRKRGVLGLWKEAEGLDGSNNEAIPEVTTRQSTGVEGERVDMGDPSDLGNGRERENGGRRGGNHGGGEEQEWEFARPEPNLEDYFEGLNLHGEEEEDLDLLAEVDDLIKDVRWLGLFQVHTTKPFSHAALLNQLRNVWSSAQGVTFNIKEPNLFLVQCHCLGDWKRVMVGGPWVFQGSSDSYTRI